MKKYLIQADIILVLLWKKSEFKVLYEMNFIQGIFQMKYLWKVLYER